MKPFADSQPPRDGCLVGFPHEPAHALLQNGDTEARERAEPLLLRFLACRSAAAACALTCTGRCRTVVRGHFFTHGIVDRIAISYT